MIHRARDFVLQILAAVVAHVNSISVGMCQGFSAVLLPQLLDSSSSILVNNVQASWIGERKPTAVAVVRCRAIVVVRIALLAVHGKPVRERPQAPSDYDCVNERRVSKDIRQPVSKMSCDNDLTAKRPCLTRIPVDQCC